MTPYSNTAFFPIRRVMTSSATSPVLMNRELTKQHQSTRVFKAYIYYITKHFPHVDLDEVSKRAGLPLAYLHDENNWVSVTFAARFTRLCIEATGCDDLSRRVGLMALSEELVGPTVYFFLKYGMPVEALYRNIASIASRFNKVFRLQVVEQSVGSVSIRLTTDATMLSPEEEAEFKSNLGHIIENTEGYLTSVPTPYGLPPATVQTRRIDLDSEWPVFEFSVKYSPQLRVFSFLGLSAALACIAAALFAFQSLVTKHPLVSAIATLVATAFGLGFPFLRRHRQLKQALSQTEVTLQKLDDQYLELQTAEQSLQRRLQEAQLIHVMSERLTKAGSRIEVLERACADIVEILHYDRVLVLLADDSQRVLRYGASHGSDPALKGIVERFSQPIEIPSDDPRKISNVYRTGRPFLINHVADHLANLNIESQLLLRTVGSKSFLCVAIASEARTHGVLCVDYYIKQKDLTPADLDLMQSVARQIALALDKETAQEQAIRVLEEKDREKTQLLTSYSRFVPFEFVRMLGKTSILDVSLGDHVQKEMTVLFSDLRGFTAYAETVSALDTFDFLNAYFRTVAPVIRSHGGAVDKYIGDGLMAFFPNEAADAVRAAVEIMQRLRSRENTQRHHADIRTGIGINHGKLVLGTIGYDQQMQGTVISDVVNTASRLEQLTKTFAAEVLVSHDVYSRLGPLAQDCRCLGYELVKGRSTPIRVYEVFGGNSPEQVGLKRATRASFEEAIDVMESDPSRALALLRRVLSDNPKDRVSAALVARLSDQATVIPLPRKRPAKVVTKRAAPRARAGKAVRKRA